MSLIPGSIPVTGFIAPTDTTDTYPVTDAIYGIDGLRNVPTYTDMYNISLERRREGMIVGIMSDNTYWKLLPSTGSNIWNLGSASNWQEFAIFGGGGGAGVPNQYYIPSGEKVIVPTYSQYWIYGDLTIAGELENHGQVVIANGGLVLSGGTFSGMTGSLLFVTLNTTQGDIQGITAGDGLTGGGSSGYVTLDVNTGLGITISSDAVSMVWGGTATGLTFSANAIAANVDGTTIAINSSGQLYATTLGGAPVYSQRNLTPSVTSGDGSSTGITLTSTPVDGINVSVYVNGQMQFLGNGSTASPVDCYFGTSPVAAKTIVNLASGDTLYWNGTVAGYELSATDRIDIIYNA